MQAPAPVLNADGAVDGRVGWLDGVRGIAILAVIVFHFEFLARQDHRVGADAVLDKVTGLAGPASASSSCCRATSSRAS